MNVVEARGLGFSYGSGGRQVLSRVCFSVREGEMVVLAGPSGGGKSTLLRCLNGLVPHFHGGRFEGCVRAGGLDTRRHQPREIAAVAGMVFQEPESQTVASTVEDEIVFGLENLGTDARTTRKRMEEALDALSISHLRGREIATLSGGERQRVALASVLTMQPRVLLLDEPTSQLDPQAARDVLAKVIELRDEHGLAVMVAEHRLERLGSQADRFMLVGGEGDVRVMSPREAMREENVAAPAVARIGIALEWEPLPLSIVEGRRFVAREWRVVGGRASREDRAAKGDVVARARGLSVQLGSTRALRGIELALHAGEIAAVMGRNGAGKTTLLRAFGGLLGDVREAVEIVGAERGGMYGRVAYVGQDPASMLYRTTVRDEIADVLRGTKRTGTVEEAAREWQLEGLEETHPRDLSVGQRQRVALAAMLAGAPDLILLDEPTRGMDARSADMLVANLRARRAAGACVVLASHEVELAARLADRVVLLADGEVIDDGPPRRVLTGTTAFSTQGHKLFGGHVLTVEDAVAHARLMAEESP